MNLAWLEELLGGKYPDDVVICGGAMLTMRGLREDTSDIDLIVSWDMHQELVETGPSWEVQITREGSYLQNEHGLLTVSAAPAVKWGWSKRAWDFHAVLDGSELYDGWRIQSVVQLYEWKRLTLLAGGNPKHARDMEPMAEHLVREARLLAG